MQLGEKQSETVGAGCKADILHLGMRMPGVYVEQMSGLVIRGVVNAD